MARILSGGDARQAARAVAAAVVVDFRTEAIAVADRAVRSADSRYTIAKLRQESRSGDSVAYAPVGEPALPLAELAETFRRQGLPGQVSVGYRAREPVLAPDVPWKLRVVRYDHRWAEFLLWRWRFTCLLHVHASERQKIVISNQNRRFPRGSLSVAIVASASGVEQATPLLGDVCADVAIHRHCETFAHLVPLAFPLDGIPWGDAAAAQDSLWRALRDLEGDPEVRKAVTALRPLWEQGKGAPV